MTLVFAGLIFSGCDNEDDVQPRQDPVAEIDISPDSASIAVGEQLEFSVLALNASGDTLDGADFGIEWEWWSTDTNVFTVEQDGKATGESPGDVFLRCGIPHSV